MGGKAAAYVLGLEEAGGEGRETLGGKGASLVRIRSLELPVPPAFIVSTEASRRYLAEGHLPGEAWVEVDAHLAELEERTGRRFGDPERPLLVSVRSGGAISMPGMMDTVLNVGLNDETVEGLSSSFADPASAWDAYARVVRSYGESVRGIDPEAFADAPGDPRARHAAWAAAVAASEGGAFPQDPRVQLRETIEAVLRSWLAPRAKRYRRFKGIPEDLGTAVIVQAMVFGNLREGSGTGVAFTRDPGTGAPGVYGDFLARAQGDDVVGGEHDTSELSTLDDFAPAAAAGLRHACEALERSYTDMADIEFTVEQGTLWVLQARVGQRTAPAAVRIALDLVSEGLIDWDEALGRIPPEALVRILAPALDPAAPRELIGRGVAASPGAAVGVVALTPLEAEELAGEGRDAVLVRPSTSPWDIAGIIAARGIVTARGGRTSHAAVVARGMSRPAVCGVEGLEVSDEVARFGAVELRSGEGISIDGERGEVYRSEVPLVTPEPDPRVETVLQRCDAQRRVALLSVGGQAGWADGALDPDLRVVSGLDRLQAGEGGRLVIAPDDPDTAVALVERAAALEGVELVLRVPDPWPPALKELPAGPWAAIAATERGRLAGRLLAATVRPAG